jgi:hypothetical protein
MTCAIDPRGFNIQLVFLLTLLRPRSTEGLHIANLLERRDIAWE